MLEGQQWWLGFGRRGEAKRGSKLELQDIVRGISKAWALGSGLVISHLGAKAPSPI